MPATSPFFQAAAVAPPDSLAILHLKRDLLTPTILRTYDDENIGYAEGKVTTTRYGNYPHSTLIGQPWGSQVKASQVDTGTRGRVGLLAGRGSKRKRGGSSTSHGDDTAIAGERQEGQARDDGTPEANELKTPVPAETGFCHLLPPTPEFWTASLPHRTQVVYTPDYSYILQRLRVVPGTEIVEAGAGSGSFTHAAARAVFSGYPRDTIANGSDGENNDEACERTGKVWSFEFHEQRAQKLQKEVQDHGLDGIATVTHRDVYEDGFSLANAAPQQSIKASAVFLDLPAPWLAFKHLTRDLSSPLNPSTSAYLCTFSPCIEQVQRTVSALRSFGWLDIEMVELSARRIESRRERVGLQEEGLRGVNATPATVDEAVGRLREVEGRDRSYHHGLTVKAMNDTLASAASVDGSEDGKRREAGEYVSKQQRLQNIKHAEQNRKLYKEGRLVHRSEPELKMHTSYLVFAVLPRAWTEEDERRAQEDVHKGFSEPSAGAAEKPVSKRQRKRAAKEQAGGNKYAEMEMKWQLDNDDGSE
ncbi:MAG: hypothetical protein LQ338_004485 [Usnochroma carphineum]|nr:MAG: hypothetical protein LQ338_004485 [Usnochroma carphineum]